MRLIKLVENFFVLTETELSFVKQSSYFFEAFVSDKIPGLFCTVSHSLNFLA